MQIILLCLLNLNSRMILHNGFLSYFPIKVSFTLFVQLMSNYQRRQISTLHILYNEIQSLQYLLTGSTFSNEEKGTNIWNWISFTSPNISKENWLSVAKQISSCRHQFPICSTKSNLLSSTKKLNEGQKIM